MASSRGYLSEESCRIIGRPAGQPPSICPYVLAPHNKALDFGPVDGSFGLLRTARHLPPPQILPIHEANVFLAMPFPPLASWDSFASATESMEQSRAFSFPSTATELRSMEKSPSCLPKKLPMLSSAHRYFSGSEIYHTQNGVSKAAGNK